MKNKKPVLVKQGLYLERTVGTRTFFNPLLYQLSYRAVVKIIAEPNGNFGPHEDKSDGPLASGQINAQLLELSVQMCALKTSLFGHFGH